MAKATLSSEERHQGLHTVSEIDLAKIIQVCHKTIKQANNGKTSHVTISGQSPVNGNDQCLFWAEEVECDSLALSSTILANMENAYTATAINSTNFCTSAKDAFVILVENALRVAAINTVGDFMLFLGKVLIVCSTGLAGIMLLNYQQDYTVWVLPLIIVCLFAFLVAHCFLSIYEMVVDVLFLCFAIDTKYNDGSPGREFYMDKVLMEFVENSRKAMKEAGKGGVADARELKPMLRKR
uniref:Choline transporter-like protein n=1 Tax=Castor canadensis TaxID=51338 RepID=A0A8B7U6P2_CASCN|nr:choline transporter-like protein 1 [Castor canadensis]